MPPKPTSQQVPGRRQPASARNGSGNAKGFNTETVLAQLHALFQLTVPRNGDWYYKMHKALVKLEVSSDIDLATFRKLASVTTQVALVLYWHCEGGGGQHA